MTQQRPVGALTVMTFLLASCAHAAQPPASDHFDGKRFFNPTIPDASAHGFRDILKLVSEKRAKWPAKVKNTAAPNLNADLGPDDIALTFVNHATFLIQCNGVNILTDPVWSKRVSPVSWAGPSRVRPPGLDFDLLPRIDVVLISHNHYDHLDLATLRRISRKFSPKVLVPWGDRELVESAGCKDVVELDWWQTVEINSRLVITFAPTQHWSKRGFFDRQKTLWGSFMVRSGGQRIYFGGDAGYSTHYEAIHKRLGAPDLALLGIGVYEPGWFMRQMHMNPTDAVAAHLDLCARQSVGMHFGTFQLSTEAMDQPASDLKAALARAGVPDTDFDTLQEGETRIYRHEK